MKCTKAIILAAGYATRRLPITKAIEKCMLPIGNRPMVDYLVEACVTGGITDIFFVVPPDSTQLKKYYSANAELEEYLAHRGKTELLAELKTIPQKARFHYVVIDDPTGPYGTAVPVWIARDVISSDEHFAVMFSDYFVFHPGSAQSDVSALKQAMIEQETAGALLTVQVDDASLDTCGILAVKAGANGAQYLQEIVEKPGRAGAPSHLGNVSNYIFDPIIFKYLEQVMQRPNKHGEYYLIDAVNSYVQAGNDMAVVLSDGIPLDGGNLDGWIEANNTVYKYLKRD